ncbi:hypothetical protein MAPG_04127 [Magnaporthiopsis poae ATCC 64411]|uniref:Conidiation-specific protein 13 n=1 Tax=Magnaporthiopsis poae (strain ATCC 64411 / 73-15) TaxID=644358 RepID=A0A0C4DVW4_MAGP6|nr:hypothetical protein MAPG_04127 [Magnaporthiopsis poae ATCC 64411]
MVSSAKLLLAIASVFYTAHAQNNDKPTKASIEPKMDGNKVSERLNVVLKTTQYKIEPWKDNNYIAADCARIAKERGVSPNDFDVFYVRYADCGEPWVFCREKKSKASDKDLADSFGKMPVRSRSYVRHVIGLAGRPDIKFAGLWTGPGSDIILVDKPDIKVMVHELMHAVDHMAMAKHTGGTMKPLSGTNLWRSEWAKDPKTVTPYASNGWSDNFAEVGVYALYDKTVPGGLGAIQPKFADVQHQIRTLQKYAGQTMIPGGSCSARIQPSKAVLKSAAGGRRKRGLKPDLSFHDDSISVIKVDDTAKWVEISCEHDHNHGH